MKRIILLIISVFFIMSAGAQTTVVTEKSKTTSRDKLVSYQMGNVQTVDGSYTIVFDAPLLEEYTVMLTPYTEDAALFIASKSQQQVVIKTKKGTEAAFDYVVFIKKPAPETPQDGKK